MGNKSCILLYLKVPKHPAQGGTPQYHSQRTHLVPATGKHLKSFTEINKNNLTNIGKWNFHSTIFQDSPPTLPGDTLKEVNRIWKYYQNIRIVPPIFGYGTAIPLYSNVPNPPPGATLLHTIETATTLSLKLIKWIWKKSIESQKN